MELRYFSEVYIPNKIVFRDEQINELNKSLDNCKKYGKGQCFLIHGLSGSGKTATLKYLANTSDSFRYSSGLIDKRRMSVLRSLSKSSHKNESALLKYICKELNDDPKCLIVDEVMMVQDFKELMQDLNSIYRETQVPIIVATNNIKFINSLAEDVRLTLFFRTLSFNPYNVIELHEILKERLNLSQAQISEDKQALISAMAGKQGSARLLLFLAHQCLSENKFDDGFIVQKSKEFEDNEVKEYLYNNINGRHKLILREILSLKENNFMINSKELTRRLNISKSTISKALDHLEDIGILETKKESSGNKGAWIRVIDFDKDALKLLGPEI